MACLGPQPKEHVEMKPLLSVYCWAFISRTAVKGVSFEEGSSYLIRGGIKMEDVKISRIAKWHL